MLRMSPGHVTAAVVLASMGALALLAGAVGSSLLPATVVTVPGAAFSLLVGGVLVGGGVLTFAFSFRKPVEAGPAIPAHVAFASRARVPQGDLDAPARPRPATPQAAPSSEAGKLEARIREVSKEINRAGVMLATGRLSKAGYVEYVEKLKRERGELEAVKMALEMRRSPRLQ